MSSQRIYLGGAELELSFPGAVPEELKASVFAEPKNLAAGNSIRTHIEISYEPISKSETKAWISEPKLLDTGVSWAVQRREDEEFPFHIAPSQSANYRTDSLHLFASHNFDRMKIFCGPWRNRFYESWLFYPYEQCVMFHFFQFHGAAVMHASGVEVDGKGYLFLGDSGAGKSTISTFFEEKIGEGKVYSDDRIVVREVNGKWMMYGTPWHGTFARIKPEGIEIAGMFFIEKTDKHELDRIQPEAALRRLLPVTFGTWWLPERMQEHLNFVERVAKQKQFPLCRLGFAPDASVVDFVRENFAVL
jgi:hypothetical protein